MRKVFDPVFAGYKKEYYYDMPQVDTCTRIKAIFELSGRVFEGPDIRGTFTTDHSFELEVPSGGSMGGGTYWSILYGRIENYNGKTRVVTKVHSAFRYKILLVIVCFVGVLLLSKGILIFDLKFLVWGVGSIVIGPFLIVRAANVNNGVVEDRYLRYLDKRLRSS